MDKAHEPGAQDKPSTKATLANTDTRLSSNAQTPKDLGPEPAAEPVAPGDDRNDPKPNRRLANHAGPQDKLTADLAALENKLRDYEVSLVERIADVDDDRRGTETRLQRAWQTQREEIDGRLRGQMKITLAALALFLLLGAAVFFLLHRAPPTQHPLDDEIAEISRRLDQLSRIAVQDQVVQDKLVALAAAVGEISASLGRLNEAQQQTLKASLTRDAAPPGEDLTPERDSPAEDLVPDWPPREEDLIQERASPAEDLVPERTPPETEAEKKERLAAKLQRLQAEHQRLVQELNSPLEAGGNTELATVPSAQEIDLPAPRAAQPASDEILMIGEARSDAVADEAPTRTDSAQAPRATDAPSPASTSEEDDGRAQIDEPDDSGEPGAPGELREGPGLDQKDTHGAPQDDTGGAIEGIPSPIAPAPEELVGRAAPIATGSPEEVPTTDPVPTPATQTGTAATGGPGDGPEGGATPEAVPQVLLVGDRPYALQLIGFFSLKTLDEFVQKADLPARVYYRKESFRGRPWFVLIHSLHENQADAAEVLSKLPSDLAALDIWIRTLPEGAVLEVVETPPT